MCCGGKKASYITMPVVLPFIWGFHSWVATMCLMRWKVSTQQQLAANIRISASQACNLNFAIQQLLTLFIVLFFVEKLDQRPKFEVKSMHVRKKSVTSNLPDDGTGTVQVFRVKGFNLEELPEKSHGVFYSGDCYVILYTYLKNGRERHIIYFWLVRTLFKTFLNILIAEVLDCQQEWQSVLMV